MKITTGVDIVGIERMREGIERWGQRFLNKIFTQKEIQQVQTRGFPTQHFAGKFAAKEAVFKAISEFRNGQGFSWSDIEIINDTDGRPEVLLHGGADLIRRKHQLSQIQISISHNQDWAVASAVIASEKSK